MAVEFDRAGSEDLPALAQLRLCYLREDLGPLPPEQEAALRLRLTQWFPAHLDRDCFAWTAREDGTVLACCVLAIAEKPPSPAFPRGKTGSVLNVYTRPEHRRRGLARRLMELLLREAAAMELDYVELKATEAGYPLYRSLGFLEECSHYRLMKKYL